MSSILSLNSLAMAKASGRLALSPARAALHTPEEAEGTMAMMKSLLAGLCALALSAVATLAAEHPPILLWQNGAPGSEGKTSPETMRINPPDDQVVSNVNFPSLTPFLPDPKIANGASVIVIPGGGHREIWITHEGIAKRSSSPITASPLSC